MLCLDLDVIRLKSDLDFSKKFWYNTSTIKKGEKKMTGEEIIKLVEEYEQECSGGEYDYFDASHLFDFLYERFGIKNA